MLRGLAAVLGILTIVLVIGLYTLLHNRAFHSYVLRTVQRRASAALGSQVQFRNYSLTWSGISPTVDIYDVVVHGAAPYADRPLLQLDHARVGVRITSLLRRTWYLNDVRLEHPVVRIFVDRNGADNLPQPRSSGQKSNTSIFDLGVRRALLSGGEVYYNNRKSALDADLHELTFRAAYDTAQKRYTGSLSYRDGHLKFATYNPLPHNMEANFSLTPGTFTLERATLRSGSSQFELAATVNDFAQPNAQASYRVTLDVGELRRVMKNATLPAGIVRTNGTLNLVSQPNRPLLDTLTLNGGLSSRALVVQTPTLSTQVRDIGAQYSLKQGNVEVRDLRAFLLGGQLTGTLTMRNITGASRSELRAALRGVQLNQLKPMVKSPVMQQVSLNGALDANAHATWGKTFNDLIAQTDATIEARMAPNGGGKAVPVNGAIHARYIAANNQVSLMQSYLRTPQTSLELNGTVSDRSALQVRLKANDLHELEILAAIVRPPAAGQAPLGLYGTASFNGAVRGSTTAPRLTGHFDAANLRVRGSSWRSVRTDVDLSPSQASLQNASLEPADGGRISLGVRAGLRHWGFENNSSFQVKVNASGVNVANLTHMAGLQTPLSGALAANLSASGTQLNPVGQGNISLTHAKISGQPVRSATIKFRGTGNQVHTELTLQVPGAGTANGTVNYFPKQQGYEAVLRATGIDLSQLQAVKDRNLPVKGVLNLSAQGRGTLQNPQLQASAQIPRLEVRDQAIEGLNLQTTVANHVGSFSLDSRVLQTSVRSRGTVQLNGGYYTDATLDTQAIPLELLVAALAPTQAGAITGQTELHATVKGPLKNKALLEAHATIPQLAVNYKDTVHLGAAGPIRFDYSNGTLNIPRAAIRGTDTDIQFQGTVPVADRAAPASLLVQGTIGLKLAQLLDPDITADGQLRFDINSYGQRANPDVQGQIRLENVSFATGDIPLGLQDGNGVLTLTRNRLDITQFQGSVGGGMLRASGGVVYRPSLQMNVALAGKGIRVLYPGGVRAALGTNLVLTGTRDVAQLRGQVQIAQLSFTPEFDLLDFMGQFGGGAATLPPTEGFTQNLVLDIGIHSAGGMNLQSRELAIQGMANLQVVGTAAQPVILGRVNLNGGDLIFAGNRYILQGGTIDFVNRTMTQPVVNMNVTTTIQQYNIQMRFWGPADHLHTSYASDPALPPADIINLVARGKTTEAEAANPSPPGMLGAQSLVASTVSNKVTSRLSKVAGISQLSIDPVLGGNGQDPGARLAIRQRVTSKIFVDFATDVTSTQNQVIKMEYQATPKVSFSGSRDQNGGFGFDTKIRKTW